MTQPALADASLLPAPAGASPGPINIVQAMLRVIAHHWWKILAIWAVLTAGLVFAINKRVKPTYESSSLLRIEPANRDLFNLGLNSAEAFDPFLQTQVELIRSPNVLSAALTNKKVATTTLVREAKDPESELRSQLQVGIMAGTYLIRVALTSLEPEDGPVIVNEVVARYIIRGHRLVRQKEPIPDRQTERLQVGLERQGRAAGKSLVGPGRTVDCRTDRLDAGDGARQRRLALAAGEAEPGLARRVPAESGNSFSKPT